MNKGNSNTIMPTLVSVVPDLLNGQGHVYEYHQTVGKAASLIGYKHLVATSPDTIINQLPTNWTACLDSNNLEWQTSTIFKIFKIKDIYDWSTRLAKYLQVKVIPNSGFVVIFLERFVIPHLLAVILTSLLIPRKNLSIWLLYRRDIHNQKNRFFYKCLNNLIKFLLPSKKFQLITDSELLSKSLSRYFEMPVNVVPIPHTEVTLSTDTYTKPDNEILCWWVGSPREEKGLDIMKFFATTVCKSANKICVLAAKSSVIPAVTGGVRVQLIEDILSRSEYLKWLLTCDICLMPYKSFDYRERTSGVFTECVIAGKIPVVMSNTWMASELSKYHLEDLIIDWQVPISDMDKIVGFTKDLYIREKLNCMQREYGEFHSLQGYANKIKMIYSLTSDSFSD